MNRQRRILWLVIAAALLLVVGYLITTWLAASRGDNVQLQTERADTAESGQAQAEADRRAALVAIGRECREGSLPRDLRFLCDQRRQLVDDADPDDPELQDAEIQEPEIQEPEVQDPDRDDPEKQDPESQDVEVQDGEVDDPDPDDPDPDDPETQDPEVQDPEVQEPERDDPEPNDPQDPPATMAFTTPSGTYQCTRDENSNPRNPTYTCVREQPSQQP